MSDIVVKYKKTLEGEEMLFHQENCASAEKILVAIQNAYSQDIEPGKGPRTERWSNIIGIAAFKLIIDLRDQGENDPANEIAQVIKMHIDNGLNTPLDTDTIN